MKKVLTICMGLFILLLSSLTGAQSNREPIELTFGVYQSDKATVMYNMFIPIVRHLQESTENKLERPVDIFIKIFRSYDEGINSISKGEVDFVRFGPSSYILAKQKNPKLELLAMESKNGKKRFQGIIFTKADSPIQTLNDVRGRSFAFGDHNSTIGRYLVQAELVKNNIFAKDLQSYEYLGRHDKVAKAVLLGDYEVGSVKESTFNKYNKENNLRIVKTFDNVTKPWIARSGMDPEVLKALRESLYELKNKELMDMIKVTAFVKASDRDYLFVRNGMKISEKFLPVRTATIPGSSPSQK